MKQIIVTAETVEKALQQGYKKLNAKPESCNYEIINLPKKSIFGKIKRMAEVKITVITEPLSEQQNQNDKILDCNLKNTCNDIQNQTIVKNNNLSDNIDINQIKQKEVEFLNKILTKICGCDTFKIDIEINDNLSNINILCEQAKNVIGKKGEVLECIQYLLYLTINNELNYSHKIHIDCNQYKQKREEYIKKLAKNSASYVLSKNKNKILEKLNSYERRIVHSIISEIDGVTSNSMGEEPNRKVIISIENK